METSAASFQHTLPADWSPSEQAALTQMAQEINRQRLGKKVVFATGVFDLFHEEHQKFLRQAKAAGDILIVGIECDARVKILKGPGRPFQNEARRVQQVREFPAVDFCTLLPQNFSRPEHHRAIIHLLRPDILAVSSHSPHREKKQAILAEVGGKVQVVSQHNPLISTTELAKRRTISEE